MTVLLFDLDGTLINSIPAYIEVLGKIMRKRKMRVDDDDIYRFNGMKPHDIVTILRKEKRLNWRFLLVLLQYKKILLEIERKITLFPQTIPCLKRLKKYEKAIATSSHENYLNRQLARFGLKKYFTTFTTGNMIRHAKPRPELFLLTAERMGVSANECLVIEDAPKGVLAAKNAGMKVVAVLSNTPKKEFLKQKKPDAFINDLSGLTDKLITSLFTAKPRKKS